MGIVILLSRFYVGDFGYKNYLRGIYLGIQDLAF
jgi:hypothetical protein